MNSTFEQRTERVRIQLGMTFYLLKHFAITESVPFHANFLHFIQMSFQYIEKTNFKESISSKSSSGFKSCPRKLYKPGLESQGLCYLFDFLSFTVFIFT